MAGDWQIVWAQLRAVAKRLESGWGRTEAVEADGLSSEGVGGGGGGGGGHDAGLCCWLQPAAPNGRSPLTAALPLNPLPPSAAAPISLSPPRAPPSPPAWPTLTPLHPLPFPREVVPTQPPDRPCATAPCRAHTEEGTGPRRWPGASKRTPPAPAAFGPQDVHLRGREGGGLAQGLGIRLCAFGGAYWPLATAHSDPLWGGGVGMGGGGGMWGGGGHIAPPRTDLPPGQRHRAAGAQPSFCPETTVRQTPTLSGFGALLLRTECFIPPPMGHSVRLRVLYGALDGHPFVPSHVASGRCVLSAAAAGAPAGVVSAFAEPRRWCTGGCAGGCGGRFSVVAAHSPPHSGRPPPVSLCVRGHVVRRAAVSLWGPGQSPGLPFACCVGSLHSLRSLPPPPSPPQKAIGHTSSVN